MSRRKFDLRRGDYRRIAEVLGCDNKRAWDRVNRENDPVAMAVATEIEKARRAAVQAAATRARRALANARA